MDIRTKGTNEIRLLSIRDEEIHVDVMDMKSGNLSNYLFANADNFSIEWPFLAYVKNQVDIFIYNSFKPKNVLRYENPNKEESIIKLVIGEDLNIYFVVKNAKQGKYSVF
jgi:hypothetical protein